MPVKLQRRHHDRTVLFLLRLGVATARVVYMGCSSCTISIVTQAPRCFHKP
jgi:hypothetical protein